MFLFHYDHPHISLFQHVLDWSGRMQIHINLFERVDLRYLLESGCIQDAASMKEMDRSYLQKSPITGFFNAEFRSAKQIDNNNINAGQTLSLRAPSK